MGLGSDLLLLGVDARGREPRFGPELAYALVSAELVELAFAGRIRLGEDPTDWIELVDGAATGSGLSDAALARLGERTDPPVVSAWLTACGPYRIGQYVKALSAEGVLAVRAAAVGSGPRSTLAVLKPERLAAAQGRLLAACASDQTPPLGAELAFAALSYVSSAAEAHLSGFSHRRERARLRELFRHVCSSNDPDLRMLRACVAEIPKLALRQRRDSGDGRTLDERIGLTEAGRNAALYWDR
jgi:hypothetical protein